MLVHQGAFLQHHLCSGSVEPRPKSPAAQGVVYSLIQETMIDQ